MSNSKYEYVKTFEADDKLLPNCWIVVRVDGKAFHTFSEKHSFDKPNDKCALDLMNACATRVMKSYDDVLLAYGQSDEYSFVFKKDTQLYSRRSAKVRR
jgi:tRNA(His) guanylyltransferase